MHAGRCCGFSTVSKTVEKKLFLYQLWWSHRPSVQPPSQCSGFSFPLLWCSTNGKCLIYTDIRRFTWSDNNIDLRNPELECFIFILHMAFLCSLFRLRREEQIRWWCGRLKNSSDIIALNLIITCPSASYWLPVCLGLLSCWLVTYFPVSVHSEACNKIISKRERVVSLAQLCSGYTHTKMRSKYLCLDSSAVT